MLWPHDPSTNDLPLFGNGSYFTAMEPTRRWLVGNGGEELWGRFLPFFYSPIKVSACFPYYFSVWSSSGSSRAANCIDWLRCTTGFNESGCDRNRTTAVKVNRLWDQFGSDRSGRHGRSIGRRAWAGNGTGSDGSKRAAACVHFSAEFPVPSDLEAAEPTADAAPHHSAVGRRFTCAPPARPSPGAAAVGWFHAEQLGRSSPSAHAPSLPIRLSLDHPIGGQETPLKPN